MSPEETPRSSDEHLEPDLEDDLDDLDDDVVEDVSFRSAADSLVVRAATAVVVLLTLALTGAVLVFAGFGLVDAFPSSEDVDPGENPSWIEVIFDSRAVVFTARVVLMGTGVVLLFVAVLIIGTVVVRVSQGLWLRRLWHLEFEERKAEEAATEEVAWVYDALQDALARQENLEKLVLERDEEIARGHDEMDRLYDLLLEKDQPEES